MSSSHQSVWYFRSSISKADKIKMDTTDSTLNQSEVDRLEGHRKLESLGLNIPLRKTKRLAKIEKKLQKKKESDSKKNLENKENWNANSIEDNNDKFQYLDEANASNIKSNVGNSAIIPEWVTVFIFEFYIFSEFQNIFRPFDGMSTAEKSKYIKSNFNENGTVIDIDLKLFFELDEAKIDLEYLDKISELVIKNNLIL